MGRLGTIVVNWWAISPSARRTHVVAVASTGQCAGRGFVGFVGEQFLEVLLASIKILVELGS